MPESPRSGEDGPLKIALPELGPTKITVAEICVAPLAAIGLDGGKKTMTSDRFREVSSIKRSPHPVALA